MWLSFPQRESRTRVFVPWYAMLAFATIAISAIVVIFGDADTRSVAGSVGVVAGNLTSGVVPEKDPLYDPQKEAEFLETVATKKLFSLENQRMRFLSKDFDPGNNWWGSMVTMD